MSIDKSPDSTTPLAIPKLCNGLGVSMRLLERGLLDDDDPAGVLEE